MTSPQTLAAHNIDAIVAAVAVPVFLLAGLPLEGWFWATALWAVNRYAQAVIERRAVAGKRRFAGSASSARACSFARGSGCSSSS